MQKMNFVVKSGAQIAALLMLGLTIGCANRNRSSSDLASDNVNCPSCGDKPPGMVEYVWEEPMTDVIEVPAGLDPEGIYYRPAHQEVVEIRQGRWKYYKQQD